MEVAYSLFKPLTLKRVIPQLKAAACWKTSLEDCNKPEVVSENRPPRTELMARNKEREARIREYTMRMKSPIGLNELESEPAFMRRKVTLDEGTHSSENTVSRTISREVTDENGNTRIELRTNNPFLHDNVD